LIQDHQVELERVKNEYEMYKLELENKLKQTESDLKDSYEEKLKQKMNDFGKLILF
jgi:hypothetical protein